MNKGRILLLLNKCEKNEDIANILDINITVATKIKKNSG